MTPHTPTLPSVFITDKTVSKNEPPTYKSTRFTELFLLIVVIISLMIISLLSFAFSSAIYSLLATSCVQL